MIATQQLAEIAPELGGTLHGGDCAFDSVSTDTRSLRRGDLFVALTGPSFDGNRFVSRAADGGAVGAIVSQLQDVALPQLEVTDTRTALGQLGHLNRRAFRGAVVAVTGSSGKTTVKEMIARIFAGSGAVLATEGNLNNEIGVPLTLLRLSARHTHAVIELGASAMGEIAYTVALTAPDVALITNAAGAHLEGFGSQENIVRGKGEIYDGLGPGGIGIVNLDDPAADTWIRRLGERRVLTFSREREDADCCAANLELQEAGACRFDLCTPAGTCAVSLAVPGAHNVSNALAAAAAAHAVDIGLEQIRSGLESFRPVRGRLCAMITPAGAQVIDDTYNANPASFRAAIDVLASRGSETVLVMGDMAELGPDAAAEHAGIGRYAAGQGIGHLHATGPLSREAVTAFGAGGTWHETREALVDALGGHDRSGVTLLVKGSRSAGMDAVVTALNAREVN